MIGYKLAQIVHAAERHTLAAHLAAGRRTALEISEAGCLDPRTAFRLLRACASIGLLAFDGISHFFPTPLLTALLPVRTADVGSVGLLIDGHGRWSLLPQPDDCMARLFERDAISLVDAQHIRLPPSVGVPSSTLVHALMESNPALSGVAFELPPSLADASATAYANAILPADVDLIMLNFGDREHDSSDLLRNYRAAAPAGMRLVIVERLPQGFGNADASAVVGTDNLVVLDGQLCTHDELALLLSTTGFLLTGVRQASETPFSVIEAVAA